MWQRNSTGSPVQVRAWPTPEDPTREPFDVGPNEEIDFPELLAGFTPLDAPPDQPPQPEPPVEQEPVAPEEEPAPAADEEVGEQE